MGEYKTPGVYIKEKNAFGTSVVEVETAVPAFIGYTEKALNGTEDLTGKPWKITSMTEFIQYFGGMHTPKYVIGKGETPTPASAEDDTEQANSSNFFKLRMAAGEYVVQVQKPYTLYLHMMLFFANGGGPCYLGTVAS